MYPSRDASRAALPRILDALAADGYRFVTVSELLALRGD
jgi:peptidoglycan/xylan/chitin deacetylase (PgdA/CDA1 family)